MRAAFSAAGQVVEVVLLRVVGRRPQVAPAEAYLRTWEIAGGFTSQFDVEKERRETCQLQRQRFLEAIDGIDVALARDSLEVLKTNACRGRHGL